MVPASGQFQVHATRGAEQDLTEIYRYYFQEDGPTSAAGVLARLERSAQALAQSPGRGHYPDELLDLGIKEYRQITMKPFRIIYRIWDKRVIIMAIIDSRRDARTLLLRRLLTI